MKENLPALTGLRFFAAFFILIAHSCDWNGNFQDFNGVRTYGGLLAMYGMPLFFVLSGFVIHYNYGASFLNGPSLPTIREFAVARFARLYPLYLSFLVLAVLADGFAAHASPAMWQDVAVYLLTLTQSWFYAEWDGKLMATGLFPLAWSVSTEVFFYLAYIPATLALVSIKSIRTAAIAILGYVAIVLAVYACLYQVPVGAQFHRWLFYFSPYARVHEFLMGCLSAQFFMLARTAPATASEARLGSVAIAASLAFMIFFGLSRASVIGPFGFANFLSNNFLLAPAIAVLLFCCCRYDTAFSRIVSLPQFVLLGEASYSIYLVHAWTLRLFNHAPQPLTPFWATEVALRIVVSIAFTFAVAYGTYSLVEVPARRWLRRTLTRRPTISSARVAPSPAPISEPSA